MSSSPTPARVMATLAALLVHMLALALVLLPQPARHLPAESGGQVKLFTPSLPSMRQEEAPETTQPAVQHDQRVRITSPSPPPVLAIKAVPSAPLLPASPPSLAQHSPAPAFADSLPPPSASRVVDRPDAARAAYVRLLWQHIAQRRPAGISLAGISMIGFRLDGQGRLLSAEIRQTSGNMLLDKLALRTVRQAAPYPAPPAALAEEALYFSIPFSFR